MRIYETIRGFAPDFFIHSGDTIYADDPLEARGQARRRHGLEERRHDGQEKVAETLDEFRGNYAYNLLDEHVRRFNAEVPHVVQWDDHETRNNWYPGQTSTDDDRYYGQELLAARRPGPAGVPRVHCRSARIRDDAGAHLPLHSPTARCSTSSCSTSAATAARTRPNRQTAARATRRAFLGPAQLEWLKAGLRRRSATWKVIASDMPLGLLVGDSRRPARRSRRGPTATRPAAGPRAGVRRPAARS